MSHELIVLRHAKSAWPVGVRDAKRPLSPRGVRDARTYGLVLEAAGACFDAVVVSPAERTRETWRLVSTAAGYDEADARFDERLYGATWWDVMDVIRDVPSAARSVLLIGHNPSLEDLCVQVASATSNTDVVRAVSTKFPTCAAARIHSELPWSKWGGDCGELVNLWTPRSAKNCQS